MLEVIKLIPNWFARYWLITTSDEDKLVFPSWSYSLSESVFIFNAGATLGEILLCRCNFTFQCKDLKAATLSVYPSFLISSGLNLRKGIFINCGIVLIEKAFLCTYVLNFPKFWVYVISSFPLLNAHNTAITVYSLSIPSTN